MKKIQVLLASVLLSGCISSDLKSPSSQSLDGRIEQSIYYAADDSFEIQTPILQNHKDWSLLQISENYSTQLNSVVFAIIDNYYHPGDSFAVLIDRSNNTTEDYLSLNEAVEWLSEKYTEPVSQTSPGMTELQRFNTKINDRPAVLVVMKEEIAESGSFTKNVLSGKTLYHIMSIQASENGVSNVWVQLLNGCIPCESGSIDEVLEANKHIKEFIESFKLKI